MTVDYEFIGKRIRDCRNSRHITQEQLALKICSSTAYISYIERGIKKPSLQKLIEIAEALGVTVNDFIYSDSDNTINNNSYELVQMISEFSPSNQEQLLYSISNIMKALKNA
jgi:transcriptional regulator with XRE-family HTH domain